MRPCAGGPIRSHGRGHRFDTCRAHTPSPQVNALSHLLSQARTSFPALKGQPAAKFV